MLKDIEPWFEGRIWVRRKYLDPKDVDFKVYATDDPDRVKVVLMDNDFSTFADFTECKLSEVLPWVDRIVAGKYNA